MSIYNICGIYCIRNKENNKRYIGKTQLSFGDRFDSHKSLLRNNKHFNKKLQNAWNKYGENSFAFEIIKIVEDKTDSDLFNKLEIEYIKYFNSIKYGYNISSGGDGTVGRKVSEETKRKIGEKNRINMTGRHPTEETKQKMSESQTGRTHNKESIEKMRKSKSGIPKTEEHKNKLRNAALGKKKKKILNECTVKEIRKLYENGKTNRELSEMFNININYMYSITSKRKWKNI